MAGRDRRTRGTRLALLIPIAGCAVFDPALPIELVPAGDASERDVASLESAGECWNLAFGTQFVVTREPSTSQAVFVAYNNLPCIGAGGTFTPGVPARIDVCPPDLYQGPADGSGSVALTYFMVISHELGHAAGIRSEGTGQDSVMGRNMNAYYAEIGVRVGYGFTDEDRALLQASAPEFQIVAACPRVSMQADALAGVRCACN